MPLIKITGIYIIAIVLFPYEWLAQQPFALKMAWLRTFAEANDMARKALNR